LDSLPEISKRLNAFTEKIIICKITKISNKIWDGSDGFCQTEVTSTVAAIWKTNFVLN